MKSFPSRRALLGFVVALAFGLAACGGEKTVTVTETVPANPSQEEGAKGSSSADIPAANGAVTGYVDNTTVDGDSLILTGWAATSDLSQPATRVSGEVGGLTVAEAVPAIEREDVVEALGEPGLAESGFELRLPLDSLECGAPAAGVEVVGSLKGESSPLNYGEGIKEAVTDAC